MSELTVFFVLTLVVWGGLFLYLVRLEWKIKRI